MDVVVPLDRPLIDLLAGALSADLEVLADLITDNGEGRVALDSTVKTILVNNRARGSLQSIPEVLEAEIRAFGSNSIASLFRSGGVSYSELATDVAKKLGGKPPANADIYTIEEIVILEAVRKYVGEDAVIDSVSLTTYIGHIVSSLVTAAGTAAGIAATAGTAGFASAISGRLVTLVAPPLAVAAAGATVFQATGPAFRITIPAVLQVAKIRRVRYDADLVSYTESLRACM